jgi:hypothetical protein
MNETTMALTQVIGPIIALTGLSLILKKSFYMKWLKHIEDTEPSLFIACIGELAVGLAIVNAHNLWGTVPEIIISALGWLFIVEGSAILLADLKPLTNLAIKHGATRSWPLLALVFGVVGGYLSWLAYVV